MKKQHSWNKSISKIIVFPENWKRPCDREWDSEMGEILNKYWEEILYLKNGGELEYVPQRGCEWPIHSSVQGHVGWLGTTDTAFRREVLPHHFMLVGQSACI